MGNEAQVNDVSDTAFWVAYFRAKENQNKKPLFRDPFAQRADWNPRQGDRRRRRRE